MRPQLEASSKETDRMHGNLVSQIKYDNGAESICLRKKGIFKSLQGALWKSGLSRTHAIVHFSSSVNCHMDSVLHLYLKMDGQLFKPGVFH